MPVDLHKEVEAPAVPGGYLDGHVPLPQASVHDLGVAPGVVVPAVDGLDAVDGLGPGVPHGVGHFR